MTTFQFALLCIATVIVCASGALVLACVFPGMPEDTEIFGGEDIEGARPETSGLVPQSRSNPATAPNFGTRPMDGLGATDYSKAG
jgi:hypothetical protein